MLQDLMTGVYIDYQPTFIFTICSRRRAVFSREPSEPSQVKMKEKRTLILF